MENLMIAPTRSSPQIAFDCEQHVLEIRGESYPENTAEFYAPVLSWVEKYLAHIAEQEVTLNLEIVYFNSSSSKVFMNLFDLLDEAARAGKKILVNWIYDEENESALEAGEEFREDVETLTFHLAAKTS